jgi:hypothetical protein
MTQELYKKALDVKAEVRPSFPPHQIAFEIFRVTYGDELANAFMEQFREELALMMVVNFDLKPTFIYPRPVLFWDYARQPVEIDSHYLIFNAPRPMSGHAQARGDFIFGIFYSALNPIEFGAAKTLKEILSDDGKYVVFLDEDAMKEVVNLYRARIETRYGADHVREVLDQYDAQYLKKVALEWFQDHYSDLNETEEN